MGQFIGPTKFFNLKSACVYEFCIPRVNARASYLNGRKISVKFNKLWFSFIPRTNLSPFTKDFRGGEQQNESIDQFFVTLPTAGFSLINIKFQNHRLSLFLLSFVLTRYGALL